MSLRPQIGYPIPEETRRVAQAAFPKGALSLQIADLLASVYQDSQFTDLFSHRGKPAEAPALLAIATILQFAEGLSDRQAAEAVRGRIDWKYALGLELTDPGFDHTVLSEFRSRLVEHDVGTRLFDTLLDHLRGRGLLKTRGRQRTDSTHVLAAVRVLTRLERVGETLRAALNALAIVAPAWLRAVAPAQWYASYGHRVEQYRLPQSEHARAERAAEIGADGQRLLAAIEAAPNDLRAVLAQVPAVHVLRRIWDEQYVEKNGTLVWREREEIAAPAEMTHSPYDPEARYSAKGETTWVGYKVHLTETCDVDQPRLIVHAETTPATTPDDNMLDTIHAALRERDFLPAEHLVDSGYTDAELLERTPREYGVAVIGPVANDGSWQARTEGAFDQSCFTMDWERGVATCPQGKTSISMGRRMHPTQGERWEVRFSRHDCTPCPFRARCTHARVGARLLNFMPREQHEALLAARQRQDTADFRERYAARAGIEGTVSQAVRHCDLRRCRYIGIAKTHLQNVLTATAINAVRAAEWIAGQSPAPTRQGAFARLQPALG
jgi:transposase